jgi:hypothetical protein
MTRALPSASLLEIDDSSRTPYSCFSWFVFSWFALRVDRPTGIWTLRPVWEYPIRRRRFARFFPNRPPGLSFDILQIKK